MMQRELSHTCEKHESKLSPQFQSFPKVVLANSTDVKKLLIPIREAVKNPLIIF